MIAERVDELAATGRWAAPTLSQGEREAQSAAQGALHCLRGQCGGGLRWNAVNHARVRPSLRKQERAGACWQGWQQRAVAEVQVASSRRTVLPAMRPLA